ncbi:hypothetical protein V2J09_024029 [Rumex salicifolius]
MAGHKRTALLVGCNYANTENELHGCINDVLAIQETLKEQFGFDSDQIELLTDAPDSTVKPTGANIKAALTRMVEHADPGDVLFFHYSGHGTRIPAKHGLHHKQDEAIVPCDFNLITEVRYADMDFRALVNKLPKEATFTFLSDSCHSGGLINNEKEQIGPDSASSEPHKRPRAISSESILSHLSSFSGVVSDDVGAHLVACFGDVASLKFRQSGTELIPGKEVHPDSGILLSGCQADETSADLSAQEGESSKARGAFSDAVEKVLMGHDGPISNRELVLKARAVLMDEHIMQQHPCLYCSDYNADKPFLS